MNDEYQKEIFGLHGLWAKPGQSRVFEIMATQKHRWPGEIVERLCRQISVMSVFSSGDIQPLEISQESSIDYRSTRYGCCFQLLEKS